MRIIYKFLVYLIKENLMKNIFFCIVIFCFQFLYGYANNPPNERTGAPGQSTCASGNCHNSYPLNSGPGEVFINGPSSYNPGEILNFTLNISQSGQDRWGFELCSLTDDMDQAGIINVFDDINTQTSSSSDITYLKQTGNGTFNGQSNIVEWHFEWEAPISGSGPITFYFAGNAANGNGNRTGDYIYIDDYTLLENSLPISYYDQIQPIFNNVCTPCHITNSSSGLNLSNWDNTMEGGNHENNIIPSDSDNSILIQKILPSPPFGGRMPPGNQTYFDTHENELQLLRDWINEGALEYPEEDCISNGDVNLDNDLNVLDVVLVVSFILGTADFNNNQICIGDLNQDLNIDVLDIVMIVSMILNI